MAFTPPALETEEAGGFTPPPVESAEEIPPEITAKLQQESGFLGAPTDYLTAARRRAFIEGTPLTKTPDEISAERIARSSMTTQEMQDLGAPRWLAKFLAPIERAVAGAAVGLTEPENIFYLGVAGGLPGVGRAIMPAFTGQLLTQAGTEGTRSVQAFMRGETEAGIEHVVSGTIAGGLGGLGLVAKPGEGGRVIDIQAEVKPVTPKPFSEFGGEAETPPPSIQPTPPKAPPPPKGNVTEPLDLRPAPEIAETGRAGAPPPAAQELVRESDDTLAGQLAKLHEGKAPAVMFTHPDQAIPDWALKDGRFAVTETPQGRFVYDTSALTADQIQQAVAADRIGDVLGYGVPNKSPDASQVIVVRDRTGTELRAVTVNEQQAPGALAAAQKYGGPEDRISIESPEAVLAKRLEEIAKEEAPPSRELFQAGRISGYLIAKGQKLNSPPGAATLPTADGIIVFDADRYAAPEVLKAHRENRLPELFNWPKKPETERARMAREQREAMAGLREIKAREEASAPSAQRQAAPESPTGSPVGEPTPAAAAGRAGTPLPAVTITERHLAEARSILTEGERPPDILNAIGDHFPNGVKFAGADFAEHHAAAQGRARELMRKTTGEASDAVLDGLHREGLYPGIETERALADAMVRAGSARIGAREPRPAAIKSLAEDLARAESKPAAEAKLTDEQIAAMERGAGGVMPDAVEKWFDDAINTVKFKDWRGRTSMGLAELPIWLSREAATIGLRAAKLAYTTGRDVAASVREGIAALRGLKLEGYQEGEAMDWLVRSLTEGAQGVRGTVVRAVDSPLLSQEVKDRISNYVYATREVAGDQATAKGIVQDIGEAEALKLVNEWPAEIPGMVKVAVGGELLERHAQRERTAETEGDKQIARQVQAHVVETLARQNTDPAQQLRMMQEILKASPDAQVLRTKREIESAGNAELDNQRGQTDQMRQALDEGRATGIEQVRHDPTVNTAARAVVDESIKNSDETRQAVIMEMAEPWSQSPEVMKAARAQVAAKANELLNRSPRPAGFTPAQHLRQLLDDLAGRAASIFAGHIQGSEPGVLLVDKLMQRLGVDRPAAVKLASSLSREWDAQLTKARQALDTRLAKARVRQERREREPETGSAVDRALRRQLREMNLKLGEAIRQGASDRQATGQHIADKIVEASGLTGDAAIALRDKLQAAYDTLIAAAQRRALEAIEQRSGVKVNRKLRTAFDRLVEIDRLAPVNGDSFFRTIRAALKLPELTEAQAREVRRLVVEAQAKPAGWQRDVAAQRLLTYQANLLGKYKWRQWPMALWYADIFSSPNTFAANFIGNTWQSHAALALEILHRPLSTRRIIEAWGRGFGPGYAAAARALRTGETPGGLRFPKFEEARLLEAIHLPGNWDYALTKFRLPGRILIAQDLIPFYRLAEVKWTLAAERVARAKGMRGEQLAGEVQELLHNTEGDWASARVQAAQEGLTKLDAYRRAVEIIEQRRENTLPGSTALAREYALHNTYNGPMYGALGQIGEWLEAGNRKLVFTRFAMPVVRIVVNTSNEGLNFFPPVGLFRVARGKWAGKIRGKEITDPDALHNLTAQATAGTLLFAGLAAYLAENFDNPNAAFDLSGAGPRNKEERDLLHSTTGWLPYSVRLAGQRLSYQEWTIAPVLAILGNWFDALRYRKLDEKDALTRVAYAFQSVPDVVLNKRVASGMKDLFELIQPDTSPKRVAALAGKTGSAFVFGNDLKWIDQFFDPQVYTADDVQTALLLNVPYARREGRPAVNVFGEAIIREPSNRFIQKVKADELMHVLISQRAVPHLPDRETAFVGNKAFGADYIRPMTGDEYYDWVVKSGPEIRRRLTDQLDGLITMSPEKAQALVQEITAEERAKAKPYE